MDKILLKIPEVSTITGLSRSTIYQLLDQPNGLPTVRVGRAIRIPAEALSKCFAANLVLKDVTPPVS